MVLVEPAAEPAAAGAAGAAGAGVHEEAEQHQPGSHAGSVPVPPPPPDAGLDAGLEPAQDTGRPLSGAGAIRGGIADVQMLLEAAAEGDCERLDW